jgi:hypothetical protein
MIKDAHDGSQIHNFSLTEAVSSPILRNRTNTPQGEQTMSSQTVPEVMILEFLKPDEMQEKSEGRVILGILRMLGKEQAYRPVGSIKELLQAVESFGQMNHRYLHVSCHGNDDELGVGNDTIRWEDLAKEIGPHLTGRRLSLSVCMGGAVQLAEPLIQKYQCNSVCGPESEIGFAEAALLWASFYNTMFPVTKPPGEHRMTQKAIIGCLALFSIVYKTPLNLFLRKSIAEMVSIPILGNMPVELQEFIDSAAEDY